jgi:shikimate kinase
VKVEQRVVVLGNSGSGKSFLAQALAAQLALPVIDLDTIFWLATIDGIQQRESWIVEGVYGSMVERLLDRADLLIWLALPWEVCRAALIEREARRAVPTATPNAFEALLAYGAAYEERTNDISRQGHQTLFDGFSGPKLRFESREQVDAFLAQNEPPPSTPFRL